MDRIIEKKWYYQVGVTQAGPLAHEVFVQHARSGAFGPHSMVRADGWSGWVAAVQVTGLFPAQQGVADNAGMRLLVPVNRAATAIAAGYLGLLSPFGIFAPLAILFGGLALRTLKREPHLHGAGRAWFGIVMGALFSVLYAWVIVVR
jgi:hypothetical protein